MSIPEQLRTRTTYIDTVELTEILGTCRKTIERLVRSGKLRAVRIGLSYKFDPSVVADYLESRQTS